MKTQNVQLRKIMTCMAAVFAVLAVTVVASADFTADCTLDGYVAMGGMVCNNTNSYLLPGNQNSPNTGPPQNMETFGYAFLKFDSNDLPDTAVSSAYLHLDVIALQDGMSWPITGTGNVGVFAVTADVAGINAGTANSFRNSIADVALDSILMTDAGLISLNVTDIVNDWITSGNNYGLILASPGGYMPRLRSMESTTGTVPVISNIPEPATLGLLGFGAIGVLCRRKRSTK